MSSVFSWTVTSSLAFVSNSKKQQFSNSAFVEKLPFPIPQSSLTSLVKQNKDTAYNPSDCHTALRRKQLQTSCRVYFFVLRTANFHFNKVHGAMNIAALFLRQFSTFYVVHSHHASGRLILEGFLEGSLLFLLWLFRFVVFWFYCCNGIFGMFVSAFK